MQFRCYSCNYIFWSGLPPMQALTDQQASVVNPEEIRVDISDMKLVIESTIFAGLSPANFCLECSEAIMSNPKAFVSESDVHTLEQSNGNVYCACGITYACSKGRADFGGSDITWVEINRLRMFHIADSML